MHVFPLFSGVTSKNTHPFTFQLHLTSSAKHFTQLQGNGLSIPFHFLEPISHLLFSETSLRLVSPFLMFSSHILLVGVTWLSTSLFFWSVRHFHSPWNFRAELEYDSKASILHLLHWLHSIEVIVGTIGPGDRDGMNYPANKCVSNHRKSKCNGQNVPWSSR